ncbi:MAG TPA: hypothetical protein VJV79_07430 [Polyangiaceae bacterium]|nr:hypothetical protein [Polyangiaceae bacterium]
MRRTALALPLLTLILLGCHSAGPYGFARSYQPLSAEQNALEGAREFDPVMAERDKEEWKKSTSSLFGIVKSRTSAKGGGAYLTLSMRTLSERNLCDDFDEDTCRVTVSEHEHATIHAIVKLTSEDDVGERSLGKGSLVRVIGKLTEEVDPDDGASVLRVSYYRHWPRHFFVTTAMASGMTK